MTEGGHYAIQRIMADAPAIRLDAARTEYAVRGRRTQVANKQKREEKRDVVA